MAKLKRVVKFGTNQVNNDTPKWIVYLLSAITIILSSKSLLIDALPDISDELKIQIGTWFDYVAGIVGVITSIMAIFTGKSYNFNNPKNEKDE